MSDIALTALSEYEIEDLYDHWKENETWPAGEFFAAIENLVDLEKAVEAGSLHLFKAIAGGDVELFGVIVSSTPVSIDLFTGDGEELEPSVGAAVLAALATKAFEVTGSAAVTKYLDSEWGAIHDQFELWGFREVIAEETEPETEAADIEAKEEEAPAETALAASDEGVGADPASGEGEDGGDVDEKARTWSTFELAKGSFSGEFAIG